MTKDPHPVSAVAPATLSRGAGEDAGGREPTAGEGHITLGNAIDHAATTLSAAGLDEPRRRARRLVAAALGLSPVEVFAYPERQLRAAEQDGIATMLARMGAREPLTRILGRREFWGLEFSLSPDTLDPRPETETVVAAVLARRPDRRQAYRIVDLGTGSGCLLLALLSEFPYSRGIGVDVAPGAAATARHNAEALGLADRAAFFAGDWGAALAGSFDIVVANPPYIASGVIPNLSPEVRDHDPHRALDGGGDGLAAYRVIAVDLPRLLAPRGVFAGEIAYDQAESVTAVLTGAGLTVEAVVSDLAGLPRSVVARP